MTNVCMGWKTPLPKCFSQMLLQMQASNLYLFSLYAHALLISNAL